MENKKQPGGWITTLSSWSQRFIPDAFPLVLILTLLVAVLALVFTESTPLSVLQNWYDGFWSMLSFTINIVMLMFTGFLVANSKPVNKLLLKLAKIPNSTSAAVLLFRSIRSSFASSLALLSALFLSPECSLHLPLAGMSRLFSLYFFRQPFLIISSFISSSSRNSCRLSGWHIVSITAEPSAAIRSPNTFRADPSS